MSKIRGENDEQATARILTEGTDLAVRDALVQGHDQPINWRFWMGPNKDDPAAIVSLMKVVAIQLSERREWTLVDLIREGMKYHKKPDAHEVQWLKDRAYSNLMCVKAGAATSQEMLDHLLTLDMHPMQRALMETASSIIVKLAEEANHEAVTEDVDQIVTSMLEAMNSNWENNNA